MRRPPRVLVAGAFGQQNPGDESVLDALVGALEGCEVAATISDVVPGAPSGFDPVPSRDRRAVAAAVLGADLVVATATVFKTLHPASGRHPLGLLGNTLALALSARAAGRPLMMVGVGAGRLDHPAAPALVRAVVRASGPIDLRDEESAQLLRAAGVRRPMRIGADVVWTTLEPHRSCAGPVPAPPGGRTAVVALSHLAGGPHLVSALRDMTAVLTDEGYQIELQPWQPTQDGRMAEAVAEGLDVAVRIGSSPLDVASAAASYRHASVVVGLRFHSLVAAAAAHRPFVAVAHEPKLAGLGRRFGQVTVPPSVGGGDLAAAVDAAVAGAPAPPERITQERRRAAATLTTVRAAAFDHARRRSRRRWPTGASPVVVRSSSQ